MSLLDPSTTPVEDLDVVREFSDVFLDDLPGIPPTREVDFAIELVPGRTPISKAPYRMSPHRVRGVKEAAARIDG